MDTLTTKAVTVVAGQLTTEAKGLINRLLGPTADEIGLMLRDWVVDRRRKNFNRIAAKAATKMVEGSVVPPTLPTRTIMALLEQASLEDEGTGLEEEWAGLLAAAASGMSVPSVYPTILSQMTSIDASLLNALDNERQARSDAQPRNVATLGQTTGLKGDVLMEAIDNLLRLRVCTTMIPQDGEPIKKSQHWPMDDSVLQITVLGRNFLRACRGPSLNLSSSA